MLWSAPAPGADLQRLEGHVPPAVAKLNLQSVGRLAATDHLRLEIMLPPRDPAGLARLLRQIQDPASTNFHRYLTPEQYNERFAPPAADYQAVAAFATAHRLLVTRTVPGRTIVEVDGAVGDIEQALNVHLRLYDYPEEARRFYAPDAEPSLALQAPVIAVSGLNNFFPRGSRVHIRDQRPVGQAGAAPGSRPGLSGGVHNGTGSYTEWEDLFMGSDFRHSFASDTTLKGSGQTVGVMEWDSYTPADIFAYESTAGLPDVPVVEVDVGTSTNLNNGDLEVPLDICIVMSMAPSVDKIIVYHGNDWDSMLTEIADPTHGEGVPRSIGCSIFGGADSGTSNCLARLAVEGLSFFYAVGDIGAFPVEPDASGHYIKGEGSTDTQPYMVSVGGTELVMNNNGASYNSETVWQGSSGGYQTPLLIPSFQQGINIIGQGGSPVYRNVPDVAAPADNILAFCTGTNGSQLMYNVNGTSCAAPLWAGFAALVNEQAQAYGNPSLGYANPAIYNVAQGSLYQTAFHDIISGNNTNSRSPTLYFAQPGYDLCTGWGSPAGAALINALAGLAGPIFVDFNYTGPASNGSYDTPGSWDYPFKTLADGVSAVSSGGTIFIKTAGSSSETMTISKPMTITASDGPATVGQ